jgi:hypothetical protein
MDQDMGKLAIALALLVSSALAATPDETAIQNTFVKQWIEALRSKDKARIVSFLHPAVRTCMNDPSTKDFFENALDHQAHTAAPAGPYRVTKLGPMQGPPPAFLPEEGFPYPVRPTYELEIQFDQDNRVQVFSQFLAPVNGSWYYVIPCPNEKGMAFFREELVKGAEQKKRAAELLADLKDPLRSELNDLLRQQQKIDAIHKYQAAAGVDLTTAVGVINALQESGR